MKKKSIYIVIGIFIALGFGLFLVVKNYIDQFGSIYSKNTNDWSSFADYIGGIANTLISLASLLIIGLITILLGRDKNDYMFEQRNSAYDQLISHLGKIKVAVMIQIELIGVNNLKVNQLSNELGNIKNIDESKWSIRQESEKRLEEITLEFLKEYNQQMIPLYEYQFFIENFQARYGRMFRYKFSKDYDELVRSIDKLIKELREFRDIINRKSAKEVEAIPFTNTTELHLRNLTRFIGELHKEV